MTVCAINGCRRRSAINYSTVQTVDDTRHSTSRRPEISQILVENRDFCPSYGVPSEYCHTIWNGKLPDDGQNFEDIVITCFDTIHERDERTDGRTDGQTPHDGIGRVSVQHRAAKIKRSTHYDSMLFKMQQ